MLMITHKPYLFGTREQWLMALLDALRPDFQKCGYPLPQKIRVSCGFTSGGLRGAAIGECWKDLASASAHIEIFIKPTKSDPLEVAAILLHELCHAALNNMGGHGPVFRKVATAMGLTGPMTSTVAGEEAVEMLQGHIVLLGEYPHSPLTGNTEKKVRKQPKWKNVTCPECGYVACVPVAALDLPRLRCPLDDEELLTKEEREEGDEA